MVHTKVPRSQAGRNVVCALQHAIVSGPQIFWGTQQTMPGPLLQLGGAKFPRVKLQPAMGAQRPPWERQSEPVACAAGGTQHTPGPSLKTQPEAPAALTVPPPFVHAEP